MSLVKTDTQLGDFIETGAKVNKGSSKRIAIKAAEQLTTSRLLWIVVVRHKVGLLAVGNVVLVLNWAFPEWAELVKSLF